MHARVVLGVGKGILFREVSSIQRCPYIEWYISLSLSVCSVQSAQDTWQANLAQLERQYSITNPLLLAKSAAVLLVVILLFFLADVLPSIHLGLGQWAELRRVGGVSLVGWVELIMSVSTTNRQSLWVELRPIGGGVCDNYLSHTGWIAVFGAVVLLVLSDIQDLEPILHKIEWSTLLFFAGLFVLMEVM